MFYVENVAAVNAAAAIRWKIPLAFCNISTNQTANEQKKMHSRLTRVNEIENSKTKTISCIFSLFLRKSSINSMISTP